jgi:hypothetical protein
MVLMAAFVIATQILLHGAGAGPRLAAATGVGLLVAAISMRVFNWDLIAPLRSTIDRAWHQGKGA